MIRILRFPVRVFHIVENAALVLSLVVMLLLAIAQILLRNIFDSGIFWADSFMRTLVLWVALLGAMVASREHNHINIDAISRYLSPGIQTVVASIVAAFSGMICSILAWFSYQFVLLDYEDQTVAFAAVPGWMTEVIIPIAFVVIACRFFEESVSVWFEQQP